MKDETLIIGASPFSIGYAACHPKTKIFERSFLLDPVFAGTLNGFEVKDSASVYSRLFPASGLLYPGIRDLSRSEILLAEFVLEKEIAVSFGTEVLSVEPDFSVVFYDNEGLHREKFGKIIDGRRESTGNYFRFTVKSPGVPSGPFRVVTELGENLYLLEAEFPNKVYAAEAKALIFDLVKTHFNSGEKWASSGNRPFTTETKAPFTDASGISYVDPFYFDTPEQAFSEGGQYA